MVRYLDSLKSFRPLVVEIPKVVHESEVVIRTALSVCCDEMTIIEHTRPLKSRSHLDGDLCERLML
jgi:hypothetical protein